MDYDSRMFERRRLLAGAVVVVLVYEARPITRKGFPIVMFRYLVLVSAREDIW